MVVLFCVASDFSMLHWRSWFRDSFSAIVKEASAVLECLGTINKKDESRPIESKQDVFEGRKEMTFTLHLP